MSSSSVVAITSSSGEDQPPRSCSHVCNVCLISACLPACPPACLPQSTAALPFGTIVIIIIIWGLVTIPLTVFGGIAGKNNRCLHAARAWVNAQF